MTDFVYDLPRLLALQRAEWDVARHEAAVLRHLTPLTAAPRALAVLAGSFNPLTRGHAALVEAARRDGADATLLLLPLRAVDKEAVTRASAVDRALVLTEWARRQPDVDVALTNRGLYVEQAALLAAHYPASRIVFVVGHDKIVQIFDPRYYEERDAALRALFDRAEFRVAPRAGQGDAALGSLLARAENNDFAPHVSALALDADAGVDALSSTVVRERARSGEPWEALAPAEAAHFIRAAQPYSPPVRLPGGEEVDRYGLRLALIGQAVTGDLDAAADVAALYSAACADTAEGRRWRSVLRGGQDVVS